MGSGISASLSKNVQVLKAREDKELRLMDDRLAKAGEGGKMYGRWAMQLAVLEGDSSMDKVVKAKRHMAFVALTRFRMHLMVKKKGFKAKVAWSSSKKYAEYSAHLFALDLVTVVATNLVKLTTAEGLDTYLVIADAEEFITGLVSVLAIANAPLPPQAAQGPRLKYPKRFQVTPVASLLIEDRFEHLFETFYNLYQGSSVPTMLLGKFYAVPRFGGRVGSALCIYPAGVEVERQDSKSAICALSKAARFTDKFTAIQLRDICMDSIMAENLAELLQQNVYALELDATGVCGKPEFWEMLWKGLRKNIRPMMGTRFALQGSDMGPEQIEHLCHALQHLYMYTCPISLFLQGESAMPLATLEGKYLSTLVQENVALPLPSLGYLTRLEIRDVHLQESELADLAASLSRSTALEFLAMSNCALTATRNFLTVLDTLLESQAPLVYIDWSSNEGLMLEPVVTKSTGQLIAAKATSLGYVSLRNTGLQDGGLAELLKHAGFRAPDIARAKEVAKSLRLRPFHRLESEDNISKISLDLDISENVLTTLAPGTCPPPGLVMKKISSVGWPWFEDVVSKLAFQPEGQYRLDLSENPPKNESQPTEVFAMWLASSPPVWHLSLASCFLGPSLHSIVQALGSNTALLSLDLSGNWFGDDTCIALGNALRQNRSVRSLKLDENMCTLAGWTAIRGALYGNKKLVDLATPTLDIGTRFADLREYYTRCTEDLFRHKMGVKQAVKARNYTWKEQEIEGIRNAKRGMREVDREIEKTNTLWQVIENCIRENQEYNATIQRSKQEALAAKTKDAKIVKFAAKQQNILKGLKKMVFSAKKAQFKSERRNNREHLTHMPHMYPYSPFFHPYSAYSRTVEDEDENETENENGDQLEDPEDQAECDEEGEEGDKEEEKEGDGDDEENIGGDEIIEQDLEDATGDPLPYVSDGDGLQQGGDPLGEMEALLNQGPDFFQPENLQSFEALALTTGVSFANEAEQSLHAANMLVNDVSELSEYWGNEGLAETFDEIASADHEGFEALAAEGNFETEAYAEEQEMDDVVDMYGAAGPYEFSPDRDTSSGEAVLARGPARRKPIFRRWLQPVAKDRDNSRLLELGKLTQMILRKHHASLQEIETFFDRYHVVNEIVRMGENGPLRTLEPRDWSQVQLCKLPSMEEVGDDIDSTVLCTQCSMDRLDRLKRLGLGWGGPLSVAVYSTNPDADKASLIALIDQFVAQGIQLSLSMFWLKTAAESWYPINHARNIALLGAKAWVHCERVFLLDVDFVVSRNLRAMLAQGRSEMNSRASKTAYVVPAFETKCLPSSLSALLELVESGEAEGFHTSYFPKGHGPTNFATWMKETRDSSHGKIVFRSYPIDYQEAFEPYVIMSIDDVPLYDERFTGYGMNKISHLYHIARSGVAFEVLTGHYVVAEEHGRSESWEKTFGVTSSTSIFETSHATRRDLIKALWRVFKMEAAQGAQPRVSGATSRAFAQALRFNQSVEPLTCDTETAWHQVRRQRLVG